MTIQAARARTSVILCQNVSPSRPPAMHGNMCSGLRRQNMADMGQAIVEGVYQIQRRRLSGARQIAENYKSHIRLVSNERGPQSRRRVPQGGLLVGIEKALGAQSRSSNGAE